jgi:hypothetical protein
MLYRHCFSTLLLEYAILKIRKIQVELKLDGTDQSLVFVDDVGLLRNKINTEAVIDDSQEVGLDVNA